MVPPLLAAGYRWMIKARNKLLDESADACIATLGVPNARQHHCSRPPAGGERKRGAKDQALGRSRGGLTTKIHMLADALGRPLRLIITAGQVGDVTQAKALLEGQSGSALLADKAYDSNALRGIISAIKAEAVIPSNRTRKVIIPHDAGT